MSGSKNGPSPIASVIGFALGFVIMRSLPLETSVKIIAGSIAGLVVCLLPYVLARSRNRTTFAQRTLVAGAIVGAIGGVLLAGPLAVLLSLVVVLKGAPAPST
jgi:hypothetical protein